MNTDYLRGVTVGVDRRSVPAAGFTGASALAGEWVDTHALAAPPVFRGRCGAHASLSGTLSIQVSASNADKTPNSTDGVATVTAEADFAGGRDSQGVNSTGGLDFAANSELDAAITYIGDVRYARWHLTVANASNAAVVTNCGGATLAVPQVTPSR